MKAARDCLDCTLSKSAISLMTAFCRIKSTELMSLEESAMKIMSAPKLGGAPENIAQNDRR